MQVPLLVAVYTLTKTGFVPVLNPDVLLVSTTVEPDQTSPGTSTGSSMIGQWVQ
jgi:hypothetical protein